MKRTNPYAVFLISLLAFVLIGCFVLYLLGAPAEAEVFSTITEETPFIESEVTMNLTSSAFTQGQPIPARYSCKGDDISPALAWDEPPAGTQSFALIMDDPDAPMGTWVHWVVIHIPADVRALPENMLNGMRFGGAAALFGKNSWGKNAYGGPCPPAGTHRYFFKLYALDALLNVQEGVSKANLLAAMEGHILAQAELMGTFSK